MLVSFGTNLLASQPDTDLARRALAALEFHVHADFFVNATARYADIVLPAATSWEREGLRTGFDGSLEGLRHVQLRPAVIAPIGEARSDTDIVMGLASRLGMAEQMFDLDVDNGHDAVLAKAGLSVDLLRANPAGITVEGTVALDAHAVEVDGVPRGFPTPTRKIEIYSERLHLAGYAPVPAAGPDDVASGEPGYPLRLGCAKNIAYCHSQHRNIASLRRLMPDPTVDVAPADARARAIAQGDWVRIRTKVGRRRRARQYRARPRERQCLRPARLVGRTPRRHALRRSQADGGKSQQRRVDGRCRSDQRLDSAALHVVRDREGRWTDEMSAHGHDYSKLSCHETP